MQKAEENVTKKQLQNLKPFKPGSPGGPGRPKGSVSISKALEKMLEYKAPKKYIEKLKESGVKLSENTWRGVLAAITIAKAAGGSVRHLEILLDRLYGKPVQKVETTITETVSDDAIADAVEKLNADK